MSSLFRTLILLPVFLISPQFLRAGLFDHKSSSEFSGEFSPSAFVELSNVNGSVTIETWDRDEYHLTVTKISKHEENLDLMEVRQDITTDYAKIEVHIPKKKGWFSFSQIQGQVNMVLTVPASVDLSKLRTVNGSLELSHLTGVVNASSVNGRINAQDLGGATRLHTVNGSITASFMELAQDADLSFETVNGGIRVHLPDDLHADLRSKVVNGSISCDFPIKLDGSNSRRRLNGQIGGGGSSIAASSVNGSIKLLAR